MKWGLWCEVARQGAAGALAAVGLHEEAVQIISASPWYLAERLASIWTRCWRPGSPEPNRHGLDARGAVYWAGAVVVAAQIGNQTEAKAARQAMETYCQRLGVTVDPSRRLRPTDLLAKDVPA